MAVRKVCLGLPGDPCGRVCPAGQSHCDMHPTTPGQEPGQDAHRARAPRTPYRHACPYPNCGRLTQPGQHRCELHPQPHRKPPVSRHRQYRKLREQLIAAHPYCHICRKPFTDPDDPPVLDHVKPRAYGGTDDPSNLKPAHRSCNGRKGAQLPSWV